MMHSRPLPFTPSPLPPPRLRPDSAPRPAQMTDKAISWKPGVNGGGPEGASGSGSGGGGGSSAADDGPHTV